MGRGGPDFGQELFAFVFLRMFAFVFSSVNFRLVAFLCFDDGFSLPGPKMVWFILVSAACLN